jgi:protein-disulfide isomerase
MVQILRLRLWQPNAPTIKENSGTIMIFYSRTKDHQTLALKKFASQIPGMDMQKFNSCFDSQKYMSFVQKDFAFATSLGLQGTPTFVVEKSDGSNSQTLSGAYPFPSFKAIIDKNIGSA